MYTGLVEVCKGLVEVCTGLAEVCTGLVEVCTGLVEVERLVGLRKEGQSAQDTAQVGDRIGDESSLVHCCQS